MPIYLIELRKNKQTIRLKIIYRNFLAYNKMLNVNETIIVSVIIFNNQ